MIVGLEVTLCTPDTVSFGESILCVSRQTHLAFCVTLDVEMQSLEFA